MSVTFTDVSIFGISATGKKTKIGTYNETDSSAYRVGGKIFYIDSTSTGATYTFYDQNGNILTDVRVGDTPYAYKISGTASKDKYYSFYPTAYTSKTWTYKNSDDEWVYTALGTTDTIGSGKTNTSIVMAADSGAYANYSGSIWNTLKTIRTNAINGCTDWFVPSKQELEALRTATDRDGNALITLFSNTYIWSTIEYSATRAWYWDYNIQDWYDNTKNATISLVAARAF